MLRPGRDSPRAGLRRGLVSFFRHPVTPRKPLVREGNNLAEAYPAGESNKGLPGPRSQSAWGSSGRAAIEIPAFSPRKVEPMPQPIRVPVPELADRLRAALTRAGASEGSARVGGPGDDARLAARGRQPRGAAGAALCRGARHRADQPAAGARGDPPRAGGGGGRRRRRARASRRLPGDGGGGGDRARGGDRRGGRGALVAFRRGRGLCPCWRPRRGWSASPPRTPTRR